MNSAVQTPRGGFSRRLPPLVMGAVALALMVAVLPSSLHLPVTGPGSQAEVAPVPGQGNNQSNLSALGLADSGTVGSGGAGAIADGTAPTPPGDLLSALLPGRSRVASSARCIGNPPRQTEDPLSPPCRVWTGTDNGGKTGKGVSKDTITIVMELGLYGHPEADYSQGPQANDDPIDSTARVLLAFFQSRFEHYGRKVRLIGLEGTYSFADINRRYDPFAVIDILGRDPTFHADAIKAGVMVFGGFDRRLLSCGNNSYYIAHAPYAWGFQASTDACLTAFAKYVCSGVVGKSPAMSTDPTYLGKPRTFGIVANTQAQAQPTIDALKQTCNLNPPFFQVPDSGTADTNDAARLKAAGISTVINPNDGLMRGATQTQYAPEWLFNGGSLSGQYSQRENASPGGVSPTEWNRAFGITPQWRWKPRPYPYYYQAAQSVSPNFQADGFTGSAVYYGLLMAFTAIQLAGPNLNAQSVESGMQSFTAAYEPPYSPHAGFGPGRYTFFDDFMIVRWDSSGSPPDGQSGSGCLRLADGGLRYLATSTWPTSDRAAVDDQTQPCQPDEIHFGDAAADNNHN